jgi:hypothetical protein
MGAYILVAECDVLVTAAITMLYYSFKCLLIRGCSQDEYRILIEINAYSS